MADIIYINNVVSLILYGGFLMPDVNELLNNAIKETENLLNWFL